MIILPTRNVYINIYKSTKDNLNAPDINTEPFIVDSFELVWEKEYFPGPLFSQLLGGVNCLPFKKAQRRGIM